MEVVIALGANLGNPAETFEQAIERIEADVGEVIARSSFHQTKALIHPDSDEQSQPDYLNAVIVVSASFELEEVFERLLAIEASFGRDRKLEIGRWQSRTLDLDIIAAGQTQLCTDQLVVPHPEMHRREFVLGPMHEVAPDWVHPQLKKTVSEMLENQQK